MFSNQVLCRGWNEGTGIAVLTQGFFSLPVPITVTPPSQYTGFGSGGYYTDLELEDFSLWWERIVHVTIPRSAFAPEHSQEDRKYHEKYIAQLNKETYINAHGKRCIKKEILDKIKMAVYTYEKEYLDKNVENTDFVRQVCRTFTKDVASYCAVEFAKVTRKYLARKYDLKTMYVDTSISTKNFPVKNFPIKKALLAVASVSALAAMFLSTKEEKE